MDVAFWRKWHRWIGWPAALFLLWASVTGLILATTEFFGADEALREKTRDLVSPMTATSSPAAWQLPIAAALVQDNSKEPHQPIDKIEIQFKGDNPTVTVFTGGLKGGEDKKYVVSSKTGMVETVDAYADKPLLNRLHSGEAFGDGGLAVAMFWALSLSILTLSGVIIYLLMRPRRELVGIKKVFW